MVTVSLSLKHYRTPPLMRIFAYEITGDTRANVGSTTITAATFASNSGVVTISPTTTSSDVYEGPQTITIFWNWKQVIRLVL